jgi:putative ABC transport system ATP-binding protein
MSRRQRRDRTINALERVGIADRRDHLPRQLSGGQEQRVAIARAIVTDPAILVADEPTGDLDKPSALAVMDLLGGLNRDLGKTVLMVTHDPATAGYAGRTLHLDKGKLVEDRAHRAKPATEAPARDLQEVSA